MSDEPSKRPWRCNDKVGYIWSDDCQVAVVGGFITDKDLVPYNGERWSADARLIVTAVNAHEGLVKALQSCIERLDYMSDMTDDEEVGDANIDALVAARAVLKAAGVAS